MNEQDYHFLLNLYETKNITKMAQQQFLTQPAMTKRIRRIEEELGCQLVLRSKRGVTFTAVGEEVIRYCRGMMHMTEQLKNSINTYQGIVGGSLNLGCSLNYCRYRLSDALHTYQELYPLVEIGIRTGRSRALYRMLQEGEISIAIIRGNYTWEEGSMLLYSEPICLVRSIENADRPLSDYPFIGHHTDADEEKRMELWAQENGLSLQHTKLWIDDITSCREMARAGLGWTILPSICLDNFQGIATPLYFKDGTPLRRNTYVFYRDSQYKLQQVHLFLDILTESVSAFPEPV